MRADWLTPLRALAEAVPPDVVVCATDDCDRIAVAPAEGLPEGWDGMWSRHVGWRFTCPCCLDAIEADWMSDPLRARLAR